MRLNLGCGTKPLNSWTNVDIVKLPGVDKVWDLNVTPWPFEDNIFEEIRAIDVMEHLDDAVKFITECWRVLEPQGLLFIQVPRFDAEFLWIDPSHKRGYHEQAMDFFDPTTKYGQSTGFYSPAKFSVSCEILPNKNLQFSMRKI